MQRSSLKNTNDYTTQVDEHHAYRRGNWRDIIFLPFNLYWEILIQFSIIVNILILLIQSVNVAEDNLHLRYISYTFEICYAADTLFALMHRFMVDYRKKQLFRPRNGVVLILDVVTLIPYWELYTFIYWNVEDYRNNATLNRLKYCIRCVRLAIFYTAKRNQVGFNQLVLVSVYHFVILTVTSTVFSVIWIKTMLGTTENGPSKLINRYADKDKMNEYVFILNYMQIASLLTHHWIGGIKGNNSLGRIIIISIMFLGFALHILLLHGQLVSIYLKIFRQQQVYTKHFNSMKRIFSNRQMDNEKFNKMITYYNQLWDRQRGMRFMPKSFKLLPLSLQKEICLDMFWEVFRHSHILECMDMSFKREISLLMRSEYSLPGDYIFKSNKVKSKMLYIVCGIVEIVSKEDNDIAILSFSNGTVIGEMASLVPIDSCCNVRCGTYCEFYVLNLTDLYRTLILYRRRTKILQNNFYKRIEMARQQYTERNTQRYESAEAQTTTIRKLKRQWRDLVYFKQNLKNDVYTTNNKSIDPMFCSNFLDLLVFSTSKDIKLKSVCIRGKWPCVMYAESSVQTFMKYCCLMAILYQCFTIPYLAANFNSENLHKNRLGEFILLDLIYIFDVYIQLITITGEQHKKKENVKNIIVYRAKQVSFLIDIFSTLPLDYAGYACNFDQNIIAILRVPKIFQLYKLIQFITIKEKSLTAHVLTIRFFKFVVLYMFLVYGFSCILTRLTCYNNDCLPYGWLAYGKEMLHHPVNFSIPTYRFYIGLHYSISIITALANNSFIPYSILDMVTYCLAMYIGYYIFSFMLSQLTATYIRIMNTKQQYYKTIRLLHKYFQINNIPYYIRTKACELLTFLNDYNGNAVAWGPNSEFSKTPEMREMAADALNGIIKSIPLFKNLQKEVIAKLVHVSRINAFPPNTEICTANYKTIWFYILIKGYCMMESILPGDTDRGAKNVLTCGDMFPVIECFHLINSFVKTTTITAVEAIMIPQCSLLSILKLDFNFYENLEKALIIHKHDFEATLSRSLGFFQIKSNAKILQPRPDKGEFYSYILSGDARFKSGEHVLITKQRFLDPFQRLGRVGCMMHYILMRKTINPRNKKYICWEIFRWHLAITETLICLFQINILLYLNTEILAFGHFSFCSCLLDFYIRMHCQYYNSQGILVSHPLKTCTHYMTTSFVVDFIAALPIRHLGIDKAFFGSGGFRVSRIIVFLHVLQLHRVISGLKYFIKEVTYAKALGICSVTIILTTLLILIFVANILNVFTCDLTFNDRKFNCFVNPSDGNTKWIGDFNFARSSNYSVSSAVLASIYVIYSTFSASLVGIGNAKSSTESAFIIPVMVFLFFLRIILFVIANAIHVGAKRTKTQTKLNHFLKHSNNEPVDEELVNKIVAFCEYTWKAVADIDDLISFRKLNPVLIMEIRAYMYMDTLDSSYFFNTMNQHYLYSISYYIRKTSLMKGSVIIRCNDINRKLYFVNKGCVEVLIAGKWIANLTKGGCFGCMNNKGITRHTIMAVAEVNTELLYINNNKLHQIAKGNRQLLSRLKESNILNYEFVKSWDKKYTAMWSKSYLKRKDKLSYISLYFSKINKFINTNSFWCATYIYVLNVHIAPISGILVLIFSFFIYHDNLIYTLLSVIWIIDFLFWVQVGINMQLFYIDAESGVTITQPSKIMKRYMKSYRFILDIVINLPYEVLLYYSGASLDIIQYSPLVRVLRIFYLIQHNLTYNSALNVSISLRAIGVMYSIITQLTAASLIWWYTICSNGICSYVETSGYSSKHIIFSVSNNTLQSILISFTYTVNLFTATGLRDITPSSKNDIFVSSFIVMWGVFSISVFCGAITNILVINNINICDYEFRVERLLTYFKYHEVSSTLMEKVSYYLQKLWKQHQGEQSPELITEIPNYLQQDFLYSIYEKHLKDQNLFSNTHIDFVRQLVTKMKRCMYLPGYCIVDVGDVSGCMYFIHKGEVEEIENSSVGETVIQVYGQGMSFGHMEGIFNIPYSKSYRALSLVDLISLKKDDWIEMLKWFPASSEQIIKQIYEGKYDKKRLG